MKKVIKNYGKTIMLVIAIIIGAICGLVFKDKANVVKPLGDLFLNLLLVIIVPLIFVTISSSISKMKQPKRLSKILLNILGMFLLTTVVALLIGFASTSIVKLVNPSDKEVITELFSEDVAKPEKLNLLERTVKMLSVDDFTGLLSRQNLIALIVMSILFGVAINLVGKKGEAVSNLLDSLSEVMYKLIDLIMYYAPIGLGCYFASLVGTIGSSIALGFLKTFVVYLIVSLVVYFGVYSLYALIAGGKDAVKAFWKNVLPSSLTALGTCSSAASVPVSTNCTKKMGVSGDIAETTISLGTSFHKDGSTIGSVFKIMFLVSLFGTSMNSAGSIFKVLGVALIATLLVTAVPIGGGTISEMLIITLMGYPVGVLPILTIIATIIDAPATLLNVVGDSSCAMLIARRVDGPTWLKKKNNTKK